MNPILVLGAGRSSVSLLAYLNDLALKEGFRFSVADADEGNLQLRTAGLEAADARIFHAASPEALNELVRGHRIVISLLPPPMHPLAARACLQEKANLLTASYESAEMRAMADEIEKAGLLFVNECGLDPGIDHMSAMEMIDEIHAEGGKVLSFRSFCGGLTADAFDDNPFRYKISWNPRNVVTAGKSGGLFLENAMPAFLPYQRLFAETESVSIPGWGEFEAYPNRDSVPYRETYGLKSIETLKRGTLRKKGFSRRWNFFVRAGMTDEQVTLEYREESDYGDYLLTFFPSGNPEKDFSEFAGEQEIAADVLAMFKPAGTYRKLKRLKGSPADFLLDLIEECWVLGKKDHDLVVMLHEMVFQSADGGKFIRQSWFGMEGEDSLHTAMAKTVGLPLGILSKLLLKSCISQKGLALPLKHEFYYPILKELTNFGVHFQHISKPL
jgi:saccharopine dehydrogenase-like NADP-dependent oxidoreductase